MTSTPAEQSEHPSLLEIGTPGDNFAATCEHGHDHEHEGEHENDVSTTPALQCSMHKGAEQNALSHDWLQDGFDALVVAADASHHTASHMEGLLHAPPQVDQDNLMSGVPMSADAVLNGPYICAGCLSGCSLRTGAVASDNEPPLNEDPDCKLCTECGECCMNFNDEMAVGGLP